MKRIKNIFIGANMVILLLISMACFVDTKQAIRPDTLKQMQNEVNYYAQK
jgi:hypothetical protein